ncbi:hypothetical protein NITGR_170093 [Nitrospina gracilis 3/211]|uniref:Uncharacterized protein n=1 Tax=Nitrospina gracilis (strain 3/211) TaxID=1266370 RepID=M1Z9J0_NITG3|nr:MULTISPECIES: hypothetical protein [Nitrospina]MCF8722874.1 hypothetical protein [Nitrospina sp. Nb-3]CCQ89836.1 hypothetical protein NITGR_170093 [Nitrospina gracilis 3/211]
MDYDTVMAYSARLFHQYASSRALTHQYAFARALQENSEFYEDVRREFLDTLGRICAGKDHYAQKCALREVLMGHARNRVMWEEFFQKRWLDTERQLIYVYFKDAWGNVPFGEFQQKTAYFQLYSAALQTLFQAVLDRYYDQVIKNSYAPLLLKSYRSYYRKLFESILCHSRGEPYPNMDDVHRLKNFISGIEKPALSGDERAYDLTEK